MDDDFPDSKQPESVAAVLKVFAILQSLADRSETGVSELSMRLAMPKATVYRFLQTMRSLGYVRQEADSERYGLTMKLFELGAKAPVYPDIIELAKPHMHALSDQTGETIHLGMLIDSDIIYVHKVDSRHMLGMYSKVGKRAPIHCTAIGKVLLAWESDQQREHLLQGVDFKRYREKTITSKSRFIEELNRTREQGFGEDREEFDDHIRCLGMPIFDRLNQAVAAISISFPTFRYDEAREPEIVAMLRDASRDMSRQIGCVDFPLDGPVPAARRR
ncbi:DNA-binding transcriptional regulator KdgR [Rhodoferax koreense]|uniref:DNA-binding transcriptional regulator KdgR n=1 Tax=Rhodoferax koreensis TaxID=1842727 RepID=A0A1P8JVL6_9BURK|nr:DNA-binding transcriptional regulator KdgR [Rhodoferax koreense]APW37816.1 DNA-binding transcriptional regulator KdgR [Rhodoferax koreense]